MENFSLWGAIVNALAVISGSAVGLVLRRITSSGKPADGKGIASAISQALMTGVGLCVMLIGIQGAVKSQNTLLVIVSVALGAIIGTLLDIDGRFGKLGDFVQKLAGDRCGNVSQGFVSASLLFCVGAMAVTGALESGLTGNHSTQYAKSILDIISSAVFAMSMGFGVMLSAVTVLLYQGAITLLAVWIQPLLGAEVITEMTAIGSLLIIGLSLNLLGVTKIKLMNYIPAIFLPILLCLFM